MTAHSVLNVRAAPEWGNSELYKYYERNGLGYGTVHGEKGHLHRDCPHRHENMHDDEFDDSNMQEKANRLLE